MLGKVYGEIAAHIASQGGEFAGAPYAAYYNMDMEDLDIELGIPVAQPLPGAGDIQAGEIPAGQYATCLHVGPYHEVSAAWEALGKYMEENRHQPIGAGYEMYLNDPAETAPEALETEVAFPIFSG